MSKKRSLIIFIVILVLAVGLIFSSTIFRVRNQTVHFSEQIEGVSDENIVSAGEIKLGKSIFLINKNEAKNKIEKVVPYAKVEKIYVTFPNTVVYEISKRVEFCFFEKEGNYFICDSALKILRTSSERPSLIEINADFDKSETGEFISNSSLSALFNTFWETISIEIDGQDSAEFSLTREKIIENIDRISLNSSTSLLSVKFKEGFSVEYNIDESAMQKNYYLMGIIRGGNSSILTAEERESGKTFVLEKTQSGMRKIVKE